MRRDLLIDDSMADDHQSASLQCRANQGFGVVVSIALFIQGCLLSPVIIGDNKQFADSENFWSFIGLELMTAIPLTMIAWWMARALYVADENGLHWRGSGSWHHAVWDDVEDYYEYESGSGGVIIELNCGGKHVDLRIPQQSELSAFKEIVRSHATKAKANDWQIYGMRPEIDWWRTYTYQAQGRTQQKWACLLGVAVWLGLTVWFYQWLRPGFEEMWRYSQQEEVVLGTFAYLLGVLFVAFLIWLGVPIAREIRRRSSQRITISREGLLFEDGIRKLEATWNEVIDYYRDTGLPCYATDDLFIVETKHGEFDFTLIENQRLLTRSIQACATNARFKSWRDRTSEEIRLEKSSERRYNYRGRETRAFFFGAVSYCLAIIFMAHMTALVDSEGEGASDPKPLIIFAGVCIVYLCWSYRVCEIRTDENGINRRGLFRTKSLAWDEIELLQCSKMGRYLMIGKTMRIGFGPFLNNYQILREEVENKAKRACMDASWTTARTQHSRNSNDA